MTSLKIARLGVGDAVQNAHGTVGEVVYFTQNHVLVTWAGADSPVKYTDADLRSLGIVRFIPGLPPSEP